MAVPKKKTSKAKSRSRRASNWVLGLPARSVCPQCQHAKVPHRGVPDLRVVQGPAGRRGRLVATAPATPSGRRSCRWPSTPWAATGPRARSWPAPGGAAEELGIDVVLVGPPDQLGDTGGLEVLPASEVIAMDEDPGQAVRRKKDSSLVRAAEAVRDGRALAMVSAGNTGATMASALLRMGRLEGDRPSRHRHAHPATGLPSDRPARRRRQQRMHTGHARPVRPDGCGLFDGPLRGEPTPAWRCSPSVRRNPRARRWSRRPTRCWPPGRRASNFVGNAEGRDLLHDAPDVVVTDGFTGNVALKTLEGSLRFFMDTLLEVFGRERGDQDGGRGDLALPGPAGRRIRPRRHRRRRAARGGRDLRHQPRFLVGPAIVSAVKVAHDVATAGLVDRLAHAVTAA